MEMGNRKNSISVVKSTVMKMGMEHLFKVNPMENGQTMNLLMSQVP